MESQATSSTRQPSEKGHMPRLSWITSQVDILTLLALTGHSTYHRIIRAGERATGRMGMYSAYLQRFSRLSQMKANISIIDILQIFIIIFQTPLYPKPHFRLLALKFQLARCPWLRNTPLGRTLISHVHISGPHNTIIRHDLLFRSIQ